MKTILVCDDDNSILEVIQIVLEDQGHKVITRSSGKGIQKVVKESSPDIILLDIWMPGMDGKEVTKLLKRDKSTANIPIILISALNNAGSISQDVGADGYISKPFEIRDLINTISKHT
jgi:two-component system, OmpR family, alkaline phosphatase synthesis response regulator PhoP